MKTTYTFVIFILLAMHAAAQNTILVSFDPEVATQNIKLDSRSPVTFSFEKCEELSGNGGKYIFSVGATEVRQNLFNCTKSLSLEIFKSIERHNAPAKVSFVVSDKTGTQSLQIDYQIQVNGNAKMTVLAPVETTQKGGRSIIKPNATEEGQLTDSSTIKKAVTSLIKIEDETEFVPKAYFDTKNPLVDISCCYPRVEYNLCCPELGFKVFNSEEDKSKGNARSFIRYRTTFRKNQGVHFFYYNANRLKYDLAIATNYEISGSAVPALYNTLFALMTPSGGIKSGVNDQLRDELGKIVKLNTDLKRFIKKQLEEEDCIDLEKISKQRTTIFKIIMSKFGNVSSPELFDSSYVSIKDQIKVNNKLDDEKFNDSVKERFALSTTPDSIVMETKKLIKSIGAIGQTYHYIVPQLQNADAITFTLNVKPKEGGDGSKHIAAEPITVPLRGGWKVDFSTGFYYSSVRNQEYSLQDVVQGDSIIAKRIVSERGDKKNGKEAFGVTALANIYPRLGTVQPAITVGLGGSLDLNYSFLLGGGVVIGKSNRVMLSGGWNLSSRKVLSDKYDGVSKGQANLPKSTTTLDTRNTLKSGFFVSLTYSLNLNIKKQQASASGESEEKKEK